MTDIRGVQVIIEGRVQGVGFRYFVREQATSLGLSGWVRNTFDGKVESYAEGPVEKLEIWLAKLQQGPRSAFVTQIYKDWLEAKGTYKSFQIAPTL